MIRSTKSTLKFANKEKLIQLNSFIDEYKNAMIQFIAENRYIFQDRFFVQDLQ